MPIAIQVPGLAHWSNLAPTIAKIVLCHPDLAARLICAPVRAVHAYAIFIQQSGIPDDELLARTLFDNHPRDLLDQVWPDRSPELWGMLERISGPVWSLRDYGRLDELLKSRVAELSVAQFRKLLIYKISPLYLCYLSNIHLLCQRSLV